MAKKSTIKAKGSNRRPLIAFRIGEVMYQRALDLRPKSPYGPQDPLKLSSWDNQQIFEAGLAALGSGSGKVSESAKLSTKKPKTKRK